MGAGFGPNGTMKQGLSPGDNGSDLETFSQKIAGLFHMDLNLQIMLIICFIRKFQYFFQMGIHTTSV